MNCNDTLRSICWWLLNGHLLVCWWLVHGYLMVSEWLVNSYLGYWMISFFSKPDLTIQTLRSEWTSAWPTNQFCDVVYPMSIDHHDWGLRSLPWSVATGSLRDQPKAMVNHGGFEGLMVAGNGWLRKQALGTSIAPLVMGLRHHEWDWLVSSQAIRRWRTICDLSVTRLPGARMQKKPSGKWAQRCISLTNS